MSAELRTSMGMRHVTVIPENFEAEPEVDPEAESESGGERSDPEPESDPTVPRHR